VTDLSAITPRARRLRAAFGSAAALAALVGAPPVFGLPMASEGFWMVMGDVGRSDQELSANFALTGRDALGVATARLSSPRPDATGSEPKRDLAALTYTRLVKRWNLPHAQANVWFVGQAGGLRGDGLDGGTRGLWSPAVLADFETTRVYAGGSAKTQRAGDWRRDSTGLRAGFSFYEVEYEEVQPWLLVDVQRLRERSPGAAVTPRDASKTEWMPMLRLIHRRWFLELGANRDGAHLGFMWVP
jgi:hypothetical protein